MGVQYLGSMRSFLSLLVVAIPVSLLIFASCEEKISSRDQGQIVDRLRVLSEKEPQWNRDVDSEDQFKRLRELANKGEKL